MSAPAGFDDLTPNLSDAEKVWRCRTCGIEQDSSGPIVAAPPAPSEAAIEAVKDAILAAHRELRPIIRSAGDGVRVGRAKVVRTAFQDCSKFLDRALEHLEALALPAPEGPTP